MKSFHLEIERLFISSDLWNPDIDDPMILVSISKSRGFLFQVAENGIIRITDLDNKFPSRNREAFYFKTGKSTQVTGKTLGFHLEIERLFISRGNESLNPTDTALFPSRNREAFYFKGTLWELLLHLPEL